MSSQSLKNNWHKYADQGMRITDIEVCPAASGGGNQYAAVWRENDDRFDWAGRQQAEQALADYAAAADIPGVGAAIIRNGRVVFRGGAGSRTSGTASRRTAARSTASRRWLKPSRARLATISNRRASSISTTAPTRSFPGWERSTTTRCVNCFRTRAASNTTRPISSTTAIPRCCTPRSRQL